MRAHVAHRTAVFRLSVIPFLFASERSAFPPLDDLLFFASWLLVSVGADSDRLGLLLIVEACHFPLSWPRLYR